MVAEYTEIIHIIDANRQMPGNQPKDIYKHQTIAVVSIDKDGKQEWVRAIPKNQYFETKSFSIGAVFGGGFVSAWLDIPLSSDKSVYHSIVVGVSGENIQIIYNDNVANVKVSHFRDTKRLLGFNKAVPVSVIVSPDGEIKKEILMDRDKKEVVLRPRISYQDDYDHVIIYGNKRKKDKFGTITF